MKSKSESILFFKEDVQFRLNGQEALRKWIQKIVRREKKKCGDLNFIFCSDAYLLKMNKEYLDHNYFTDIITFDNSTDKAILQGDIFISADRVRENAKTFSVTFDNELRRVMIHGVLHLCGYKDKTKKDQLAMKQAEDRSLALY